MKISFYLFSILIMSFGVAVNAYSQELTTQQKDKIMSEITTAFEKSIKAAETLDSEMLAERVNDSLQAGFIVGGNYFRSFNEVMADFDNKKQGCISQKMYISDKKITVLSNNAALLTASGNYSLYLEDGRTLTGKFIYTIVYSKVNGEWKIIHSNM